MNHVNAIRYNDEYQCSHCGKSWDIHEEAPDCKMTLVSMIKMKTVDYFGLHLTIPSSIEWIHTNEDGVIRGWTSEVGSSDPQYGDPCEFLVLATVNLHGLDWRETLRKC